MVIRNDYGQSSYRTGLARQFFVLVIGRVKVEQVNNGKASHLVDLGPGDSFGEMTLVDKKVRSTRVRAMKDSVALHFQMAKFRNDTEITSCLYLNIARILVQRLKNTNLTIAELTIQAEQSFRSGDGGMSGLL